MAKITIELLTDEDSELTQKLLQVLSDRSVPEMPTVIPVEVKFQGNPIPVPVSDQNTQDSDSENTEVDPEEAKRQRKRERQQARKASKFDPSPAQTPSPDIDQPSPTDEPSKPEETPSVTRQILREILSEKVDAHRAEIKAKLTEIGAANISTLDEKDFLEMYQFLSGLK